MKTRLNFAQMAAEPQQALFALEKYLNQCSLEQSLRELVKMRASQRNGCAYCLDMHSKDARAMGESEQRLYLLNAWRESPFYSDRERAALAWTEAVTLISHGGVSDKLYEEARQHFSEQELVDLTFAVTTINTWNRLAISFRMVPGNYRSPHAKTKSPEPQPA